MMLGAIHGAIGSVVSNAYMNAYANPSQWAGLQNAQGWSEGMVEYEKLLAQQAKEQCERMAKASAEQRQAWADAEQARIERERKYQHDRLMARICDKDTNMATRVERRRKYLREKWAARGKVAAVGMISLPITIGGLALLWRFAVWAIFS